MSDIDLYKKSPESYDVLQNMRPDYVGAGKAFINLAIKFLDDSKDISVVDFCCGTGEDTRQLSEKISIDKAVLIDTNQELLNIALEKGIKAKEIKTICSDILNANMTLNNDVVVSMFAYHHVPDSQKMNYINKVKETLKTNGILLLGEIYTTDKQTTLNYYEYLIKSIPNSFDNLDLQNFLRQTAKSDDFEYKVSRSFTHGQLIESNFELLESIKIWPNDNSFPEDVGTFVEVWKKK